jgi:ABC-type Mn2+/Zn2+ transport system ATPase subunit
LGLNGAGKSSLMKIIAGVDDDFEGELEFPGNPRVGYLEQVSLLKILNHFIKFWNHIIILRIFVHVQIFCLLGSKRG